MMEQFEEIKIEVLPFDLVIKHELIRADTFGTIASNHSGESETF
jgi:hypothetical protein